MAEYSQIVRAVFNNLDVLAWAIDMEGTVTLSEGRHLAGVGMKPGQLVGTNLIEMYAHAPETQESFRRSIAGEGFFVIGSQDGRDFESHYIPFYGDDHQQLGVVGITTDITERLRDQKALAAQTAALREQAELLDLAQDAIFVRTPDDAITYWNRGAELVYGYTKDQAIGANAHKLLRTEFPATHRAIRDEVAKHGRWEGELKQTTATGKSLIVASRWVSRNGGDTTEPAILEINTDITERKNAELAAMQRQEEIIRAQAIAIEELSTPLIPITDEILVMPLIGVLDSNRAQQLMQTLLSGLAASRGKVVILDITGVPVVDTAVAGSLLRSAQAVRLLGAEVILTGIRPEVAQTLVAIDARLDGITTRSTLQSAITHVLGRRIG